MPKVAFLFPGQGSQAVGMGSLAYTQCPEARSVFEQADSALGESLSTLCFDGPEDALTLTANTQPALLTTSIALYRALGARCDVVAGHSLGEYTANVVAGTLSFIDALHLVRKRGEYMQQAVPIGVGAMAAVIKADRDTVERICEQTPGVVEPANYNCRGQIVISGERKAVDAASEAFKAVEARAQRLPVSAPFHSSLMLPAEKRLSEDLARTSMQTPRLAVYANVDARPLRTAEEARIALQRQVSRAVLWEQSVKRMIEDGVELFVEIGSGSVLTRLMKRIDRSAHVLSVQAPQDFAAAREAIADLQ